MIVCLLDAGKAPRAVVGGKGRSLARLVRAGFATPSGFILTTAAYEGFLDANNLRATLRELARPALDPAGFVSFERASAGIVECFGNATMPPGIAAALRRAYRDLGGDAPAVAVRSSATAEDRADLSFAGQQDTYLNVRGEGDLLLATRRCWESLWSARALNYRHQMGIDHHAASIAVVVQLMVEASVSGVLFTANPITGVRDEVVVNAGGGIGDAVAGGRVTPDAYVVNRDTLAIKETGGGRALLPAPLLKEVAAIGVAVERLCEGVPQDVEWAVAGGKPWLLQARPITNLPPPPLRNVRWEPPEPDAALARTQLMEHIPGPVSTLFAELYLTEACQEPWARDFARTTGVNPHRAGLLAQARHITVNGFAYKRFAPPQLIRRMQAAQAERPFYRRWQARAAYWWDFHFRLVPRWRDRALPAYLATIREWRRVCPEAAEDDMLLSGIRALAQADADYWFDGAYRAINQSKSADARLCNLLSANAQGADFTGARLLGGLPSRAMQAHEELRAIAVGIRGCGALRELVLITPARRLREAIRHHAASAAATAAIDRYLDRYGQQVYTLDFAEPAMGEDPTPALQSLQELVRDPGPEPEAQRVAAEGRRRAALRDLERFRRGARLWEFRIRLWLARRYYPQREEAMFFLGAAWSALRPLALELGRRCCAAGTLAAPDDIFHLTGDEIAAAIRGRGQGRARPQLRRLASERRALLEARRSLRPPRRIPAGEEDASARDEPDAGGALHGFPISPGIVTGEACVIQTRADFHRMKPGGILVCASATPAWTQLFGLAAGLVTDIGGQLAHGSLVAREYGIPAVSGLNDATERIASGQQIVVDGDRGKVIIIATP